MEDRMDVIVMGRKLGTASGWDGDMEYMIFYNFKPATEAIENKGNDLSVSLEYGTYSFDDGNALDLLPILARLPVMQVPCHEAP